MILKSQCKPEQTVLMIFINLPFIDKIINKCGNTVHLEYLCSLKFVQMAVLVNNDIFTEN